MGQNFKFFLIISSLGIISSYILYYLNDVQPKPYMDEIFHVKQMQKYCLGRFSEVRWQILFYFSCKINHIILIQLICVFSNIVAIILTTAV